MTLAAGENGWSYIAGFTDTSSPRWPLLASAPSDAGPNLGPTAAPTYVSDESKPGGIWKGKKAVVLRCDGSANVETTYNAAAASGGSTGGTATYTLTRANDGGTSAQNLFTYDANTSWMTSSCQMLQPLPPTSQ